MQKDIFQKAHRLEEEGRVRLTDETARGAYFEVSGDTGTHYVRVMNDNTFNCTCTWGSLKGATYGALCSHVVAAILDLAEKAEAARRDDARKEEHALA